MGMGVLAGAEVSNAIVYGRYPASAPLLVVGLAWATIMAARAEWRLCGSGLAAAAVGAGAAASANSAPPNCPAAKTSAVLKISRRRTMSLES